MQERYERLVALQEEIAWAENKTPGRPRPSRCWSPRARAARTAPPHRLSGRARDNRLVHFAVPAGVEPPRPGDVVTVEVTYAAPHHLVADGPLGGVRRTRAGDAWEAASGRRAGPGRRAARHADGRRPAGRPAVATTCG